MTEQTTPSRHTIQVNKRLIGPRPPMPRTIRSKKMGELQGTAVHLEVARKLSSPLMMGPPLCDELLAFVQHVFTEEEAAVVRHLKPMSGKTSAELARRERRLPEEIEPVLHRLAFEKRVIAATGPEDKRRYRLMPIMPGIFEMALIGETPETLTDWHRRFAELFEALYDTGYSVDYQEHPARVVRALSASEAIDAHPMALPSDRLEVVLDRFDAFGVGHCQCRTSAGVVGRACDRPIRNCTVMGEWAEMGIEQGWLTRVSKKNVLDIKREAESHGLVTWILNVESTKGQASCSCCACCCKAMRVITDFNTPGMIAPAHFTPRFDLAQCNHCGRCARSCPTHAITVDLDEKTHRHDPVRCIGCGLCVLACEKQQAVRMEPVPDYRMPYRSWFSLWTRSAPKLLKTGWGVWRRHR